ncbi:MAG: hypothetical protein ACMZ7B_11370 [Balneola sp.]
MKAPIVLSIILLSSMPIKAQYEYEPSKEYPFGRIHPDAPEQLADFGPMIGESKCESVTRAPDQSWNPPHEMIWRFKYIMNGMAVQDEALRTEAPSAGSIRQFNPDSSAWYVHYYSSGSALPTLPSWEGNKTEDGKIILYREQKAPNGVDGFFRITFFDVTDESFEWLGEWVNTQETFSFPTWKISCDKIQI